MYVCVHFLLVLVFFGYCLLASEIARNNNVKSWKRCYHNTYTIHIAMELLKPNNSSCFRISVFVHFFSRSKYQNRIERIPNPDCDGGRRRKLLLADAEQVNDEISQMNTQKYKTQTEQLRNKRKNEIKLSSNCAQFDLQYSERYIFYWFSFCDDGNAFGAKNEMKKRKH